MFSLIITSISIALVAALALATLYYGGDAFNQGRADAAASKILNQGQQLLGAADLFRANMGRYPDNVAELVSDDYLKTIPVAQATALQAAMAAGEAWGMPRARVPVFVLPATEASPCKRVNHRAYGMDGILPRAHDSLATQCYGPTTDTADLTTVVAKSGAYLREAALANHTSLPTADVYPEGTALPAADAEGAWTARPGEALAAETPAASPPDGTDAAACLTFTTSGALTYTAPQGLHSRSENFGMYNACTRPLVVRAYDDFGANTMFEVNDANATEGGAGAVFLPTVHRGEWYYGGDLTVSESGELSFDLYSDWAGSVVVSIDHQTAGVNDLFRMHAGLNTDGQFKLNNTILFEARFADEPATAFVPKVLNLTGTIPASPEYTCDPVTYSCERLSGGSAD